MRADTALRATRRGLSLCGALLALVGCKTEPSSAAPPTAAAASSEPPTAAAASSEPPNAAAANGEPSSAVAASSELASAALVPVRVSEVDASGRRLFTYESACMGTHCTLSLFHADAARVAGAVARAFAEIRRLDALLTTWLDTSEVSRINLAAGSGAAIPVGNETFEVLKQSLWIADRSGGAFDITVGAFKGLWKFDQDNDGSVPAESAVRARLELVNYRDLRLDEAFHGARLLRAGQQITLGGIAKGYVVDRAVAVLRGAGLDDFLVQAGGDLFAAGKRGDREWKAGVQDPRAERGADGTSDQSFAMLALEDAAFNTSGDYERFIIKGGKRYHHILDPRTGFPVSHTRSVTVLAPTSFMADTLDTAIFVLGAERGLTLVKSLPGVEVLIVDGTNKVHMSPGLQGKLLSLRQPSDGI